MANHEKREGMDQPPRNTLSAIDRLLAEWGDETLKEGEFTADMVTVPGVNSAAIGKRLVLKAGRGELNSRIANIKGRKTRIYSYPNPAR